MLLLFLIYTQNLAQEGSLLYHRFRSTLSLKQETGMRSSSSLFIIVSYQVAVFLHSNVSLLSPPPCHLIGTVCQWGCDKHLVVSTGVYCTNHLMTNYAINILRTSIYKHVHILHHLHKDLQGHFPAR